MKLNILFQDNVSSTIPQENTKESSGKRTRHLDIVLFYVTDLINTKYAVVQDYPTHRRWEDYDIKFLLGSKFKLFRNVKINLSDQHHLIV